MQSILCLDLGTQMGWVLRNADGTMGSGSINLLPDRTMRRGTRFLNFQKFLNALPKVQDVYFEQVFAHKGTHAAHIYGGFMAILMAWCEQRSTKYHGISVQQIKQAVTKNCRAAKADIIEAVKKLGHEPSDDNEADAIAILQWVKQRGDA